MNVARQTFDIPQQSPARTGVNIIGELNAASNNSPQTLIGAHYDTVPGSPGADDNASGVSAMLECARVLVATGFKHRISFIAFDAEEIQTPADGLHGSTAFVQNLKPGDRPSAAIIFESIGFSSSTIKQRLPRSFRFLFRRAYNALKRQSFKANSLLILSKSEGIKVSRHLEQIASKPEVNLPTLPLEVPKWMPLVRNLRRSDHAPFWLAGIPAVMISDTAFFRNPYYHQPTDTPETVDASMIAQATRMVLEFVETQDN
ncbi:MAG TPA: M20/M25/M40 family metallo-hydrolase [Dehalococcoidia bacterium]|jgi:Iap family predicted aminopeptidase|nr:M20/M25/M40 family metallo-hydrolase [Dehalococcoidia bacterium]HIK90208.1 M20/M25/M40 family metallo-hydrolase [Dehalococcoidia bacterium]